jgi:hypothetical protein
MILLIALSLTAAPASAADSGHCDSKPFTLKKPPAPAPVAAPAPKPKAVAATKPPKPHKGKYVLGCKQPKS